VGDVLLGVCVIIGAAVYLYADANLPVLQNSDAAGLVMAMHEHLDDATVDQIDAEV
jgi:hypothetical protein